VATLRRLWREPLLHFLVLGAALFALEAQMRPRAPDDTRVIVISPDFVRALSRRAEAPTEADPEGLVRAYVREEALFREAKRLGLDDGDAIVRRRLIQKLEFLLRGLADLPEPTDAELDAFVHAHAAEFQAPAQVWFDEVYFAHASTGAQAPEDANARARRVLAELSSTPSAPHPESRGDPRPGGYGGQGVTRAQLTSRRSASFATAVFEAPLEVWSGPVDADLGSHLVFVSRRLAANLPALASIRARAKEAFLDDARERAFEQAAERVVARYRVERPHTEAGP